MDNINKLKDMLLELPEVKSAKHTKSVESAVTTAWGEEVWDNYKLSRDCLQNMVDGCVESNIDIDQIKITTDNDQIKVFAPNEYSLEKLYYIGSTKSEKDVRQIGAHGEGIKKVFSDLASRGEIGKQQMMKLITELENTGKNAGRTAKQLKNLTDKQKAQALQQAQIDRALSHSQQVQNFLQIPKKLILNTLQPKF